MPSSHFFVRLVAHRPNFAMSMTADEQAAMRAHTEFLLGQLTAGKLVVAGPVMDPTGVFGMGVFEAESIDEVRRLLESDPAKAIGRHEVSPMGPTIARSARPSGS
ncbi:YciI family protein [Hyalangium rubrum]|uniref:YciI family protein n=1 Tax=Hyalangium rubrum TaxID=3103134 RepID=A0ABU5HG94_9BACT|nr:YciI family protein [Hyalangium sp. s54d21]MDY7232478.1 YciI family protein [Hyalangium sp. s54d21]